MSGFSKKLRYTLLPLGVLGLASACNSSGGVADSAAQAVATNQNTGAGALPLVPPIRPQVNPPPVAPAPTPTSTSTPEFQSCVTGDPHHLCIGLKVVSYLDSSGKSVLSKQEAIQLVQNINEIWQACDIGFQIEEYSSLKAQDYGLQFSAASGGETASIRQTFSNGTTFLLVATGNWTTSAIAWAQMPGNGPYGVVVDSDYSTNAVCVAHELGHYQGLDHDSTSGNVMYPVVFDSYHTLSASQCSEARSTDLSFWPHMLRN